MSIEQINTLVNLVVQVLVLLGIIGLPAAYAYIVPRLPHNMQLLVRRLAVDAVASVQQKSADLAGPDKRVQATQEIQDALAGLGIKGVPSSLIGTALESAVYAMKQDMQLAQPAQPSPAQPQEPVPPTPPAS